MFLLPIPKDGNCLFHALASFFQHPNIRHDVMRRMLVHYIYQNADQFETDISAEGYRDVEEYCEYLSRDRCWGDGLCLQAFAMLFKVNVWIYYPREVTPTCLLPFEGRPNLALLLNGNHYDRVLSL